MKTCTKFLTGAFMIVALAVTGCSVGIEKFSQNELVSNLSESSKEAVFEAVLAGKNADELLAKLSDEQKAAIFDEMLADKSGEELFAKLSNEQKASIFDKLVEGKRADETLLSILTEEEILSIKASGLTVDEKAVIFDEVFADKRVDDKVTELLNDEEKAAVFDSLVDTKLTKDLIVNFISKSGNETLYNEVKKEITDKLTKEELVALLDATDTTAPGEVTNLTVIQKSNDIIISWIAGEDTDNDLLGYLVSWEKASSDRAITALEKDTMLIAKNNNVTFSNLGIGIKYTFTVQAVDFIGNKSTGVKIEVTPEVLPEEYVKVSGVTITGTEKWIPSSYVFKSGKTFVIPSLIVCDHEVTRGEYKAIMGIERFGSCYDKDGNSLRDPELAVNNPVTYENWYAAITYCNKRSLAENLTPCYEVEGITDWKNLEYSSIPFLSYYEWWDGRRWGIVNCDFEANGYRLPTIAEWEWLARGGENYKFAGSDIPDDVAWYSLNTNKSGTRDVKTKMANGYGLYDMSGNVAEWCWDNLRPDYDSEYRVSCGGSYETQSPTCNSFDEFSISGTRYSTVGFRVVRNAN